MVVKGKKKKKEKVVEEYGGKEEKIMEADRAVQRLFKKENAIFKQILL